MDELRLIEQLNLPAYTTKSAWTKRLTRLSQLNNSVQFLIGDTIIAGQDTGYIGKNQYDEAEKITGIPKKTLKQYVWVCKKIAPDNRNAELNFTSHKQLASLPILEQEEVLTRVKEENLGNKGLREAIKQLEPDPTPTQVQDIEFEPVDEPKTINDLGGDLVNLPEQEKTSLQHVDYLIEEAESYLNDGLYLDEYINLLKEYRRENF